MRGFNRLSQRVKSYLQASSVSMPMNHQLDALEGRWLLSSVAGDDPLHDSGLLGASALVVEHDDSDAAIVGVHNGATLNPQTVSIKLGKNASETSPDTKGQGYFTLTRKGKDLTQSLTVHYTVTGLAENGVDYAELSGAVEIPAGKKSVRLLVTPVNDALVEPVETVIITLNADDAYQLNSSIKQQSATLKISDNEPVVSIKKGRDASEINAETKGQGYFIISRAKGDLSEDLTVHFDIGGTAGNSDDYEEITRFVVIPAGQKSVRVNILPVKDSTAEATETVILTLQEHESYRLAAKASSQSAAIKITDASSTITIKRNKNASESDPQNKGQGSFALTRSGKDLSEALTVHYTVTGSAENGEDYEELAGSVTFAAGQKTLRLNITPVDDLQPEGSENVILTLVDVGSYWLGKSSAATLAIADNEPVVEVKAHKATASENGTRGVFRFTRSGKDLSQAVMVKYTVGGTAQPWLDYALLIGQVTIPAGQKYVDVAVMPFEDLLVEGNETVVVTLLASEGYAASATRNSATVTLRDVEPLTPVSLAGYNATVTVTSGSTGFIRSGAFIAAISYNGNQYLLSGSFDGPEPSRGTINYERTGANTATITMMDSLEGSVTLELTYTSKTRAKFERIVSGKVVQKGTLNLTLPDKVLAPATMAGKTGTVKVLRSAGKFAYKGSYDFKIPNATQYSMVSRDIPISHGTYTYTRFNDTVGLMTFEDSLLDEFTGFIRFNSATSADYVYFDNPGHWQVASVKF